MLALLVVLIPRPPAIAAAEKANPTLLVVWPPDNATVDGEQVRVGGRTDQSAAVTVNGRSLRVWPTGAFAGTAPLQPGENRLVFRAEIDGAATTDVRTVARPQRLRTLPKTPIRFDEDFAGQPSEDLEVRPGDTIRIAVKGSPGRKATFRIGSGQTHYPLFPASRNGVEGFYEGAYEVRAGDQFVQARLSCYLWSEKSKPAVSRSAAGRITVNANPFPNVARTMNEYTQLRAEASGGAPLAVARSRSWLNVVGKAGTRLRVALSPGLHVWLGSEQVEMAEGEPPLRRGVVRNVEVNERYGVSMVRIPLGLRLPFAVRQIEPAALEVTLFGVENRLNWIIDRTQKGQVETIAAVPSGDAICRLIVRLREGKMAGWRGYYADGDFCLDVRHPLPPPADAARPLAGRTIVLDPGHGGASKGTIGSTGVEEKTINRQLCEILKRRLEAQGAQVRLTRGGDGDVSLDERARLAEEGGGDLFVSVHNNSIALTGDPLAATGAGVFYYHPHARQAAEAMYRRMLTVRPPPQPWGLVTADLFVCREITAMPAVLLECLFLSHPGDEMLLLDNAFAERYMEAVTAGIADWSAAAGGGEGFVSAFKDKGTGKMPGLPQKEKR